MTNFSTWRLTMKWLLNKENEKHENFCNHFLLCYRRPQCLCVGGILWIKGQIHDEYKNWHKHVQLHHMNSKTRDSFHKIGWPARKLHSRWNRFLVSFVMTSFFVSIPWHTCLTNLDKSYFWWYNFSVVVQQPHNWHPGQCII